VASIKDDSERLWQGQGDLVFADHPVAATHREGEEIAEACCASSRCEREPLDTGDGLVMLDTGGEFDINTCTVRSEAGVPTRPSLRSTPPPRGPCVRHEALRGSDREGLAQPVVYAHEDLPSHFDRYTHTLGWNTAINKRQFGLPVDGFRGPSTTGIRTSRTRTG
jgi:hypothetical protein